MRGLFVFAMLFVLAIVLWMAQISPAIGQRVYLIPEGYVGPVVVIYDIPDADQAKWAVTEGATVFKVPKSGVLLVKNPYPGAGLFTVRYYYEGTNRLRSELPVNVVDKRVLQVFSEQDGFTSVINSHKIRKRWYSFLVGIPSSRSDWGIERKKTLTDALLGLIPVRKQAPTK